MKKHIPTNKLKEPLWDGSWLYADGTNNWSVVRFIHVDFNSTGTVAGTTSIATPRHGNEYAREGGVHHDLYLYPGSYHPGSLHFGLGDGSVRSVSTTCAVELRINTQQP